MLLRSVNNKITKNYSIPLYCFVLGTNFRICPPEKPAFILFAVFAQCLFLFRMPGSRLLWLLLPVLIFYYQ